MTMRIQCIWNLSFLILFLIFVPALYADPNNYFEADEVRVTNGNHFDYHFTNPAPNTTNSPLEFNPDWDNHSYPGHLRGISDKLGSSNTTALFQIKKSIPQNDGLPPGSVIDYQNTAVLFNKTGTGSGDAGQFIVSFKRPNFDLKGDELMFLSLNDHNIETEGGDLDAVRLVYLGKGHAFNQSNTPLLAVLDEDFNVLGSVALTIGSLGSTFGMALTWNSSGIVTAKYATTFSTLNLSDTSWTTLGTTSNIYESEVPNGYNYHVGFGVAFNPEPSSLLLMSLFGISAYQIRRKRLFRNN